MNLNFQINRLMISASPSLSSVQDTRKTFIMSHTDKSEIKLIAYYIWPGGFNYMKMSADYKQIYLKELK